MSAVLEHEPFCLPRPGNAEPRTERYTLNRTALDGVTVTGRTVVHRCQECGAAAYVDLPPRVMPGG